MYDLNFTYFPSEGQKRTPDEAGEQEGTTESNLKDSSLSFKYKAIGVQAPRTNTHMQQHQGENSTDKMGRQ